MANPIIERELIGILRTRRALALQVALAAVFALLVVLRWPTDAQVGLSGAQSREVFRAFGYGLLAALVLLVPAFPATSLVREKARGTLALLLNSPMRPAAIYFGKLGGVLGFVLILLTMSLPAAAACYAMGGLSIGGDVLPLYAMLALVAVEYSALALFVSSHANSADSALRITYGLVLVVAVVTLGPHLFLQGQAGPLAMLAEWLRCLSPIPAVMEILDHADVGAQGLVSEAGIAARHAVLALVGTVALVAATVARLNHRIFDRARPQGIMTEDRETAQRLVRRLIFLVDPQRRSIGIPWFVNPVMVKEFRSRRFGRFHWTLRLVAVCAVISLALTIATTTGTMDWGVETIGGIMVILQVALIVLVTPGLGAGLISSERESGGWELLRMTPLSAGRIVRGKLMSVVWTLLLILLATLPGYAVMVWIEPAVAPQVRRVLVCLVVTAAFALVLSAAVSSLFRRTAPATATAYLLLMTICAGTMLVWLGRDAPFRHATVEAVLTINPMAAAFSAIEVGGFQQYELVPANWWFVAVASAAALVLLGAQTWRLSRPQ